MLEGFLIGLLGSIHCIGMCGPIALLIPTSKHPVVKFYQIITYNSGRVLTYSLIGLVLGLIGASMRFANIQQYISIGLGGLLLLIGVLSYLSIYNKKGGGFLMKFYSPVKSKLGKLLGINKKNLFAIGILNGLLPCGLVYVALALAITKNSIENSMLTMALFGLGTMPAMIFFMYFKSYINAKINIKHIIPYAMIVMGGLLFIRGLNLGIPYLSPVIEQVDNEVVLGGCCNNESKNCKK